MRLPFRCMPSSWGLYGDAYEEAKAYYELEGEDLERRLLEIRAKDAYELHRGLLDIDYKYRRITTYEHAKRLAAITHDGVELERELVRIDTEHGKISQYEADCKIVHLDYQPGEGLGLALLDVEYRHGKLQKNEYEKRVATLKNEPWIAIVDSGFDPEQGIDGVFFEFDWNKAWIEFLKLNGYIGSTDEQIVDDWFSDVCRSYVNPEINPLFPKSLDLP